MPATVKLSRKAQADLREITEFYTEVADQATANQIISNILDEIQLVADDKLLGQRIPNYDKKYQSWLVLKSRYKVYFKRVSRNRVRVLRVYSTKRKPLDLSDIL